MPRRRRVGRSFRLTKPTTHQALVAAIANDEWAIFDNDLATRIRGEWGFADATDEEIDRAIAAALGIEARGSADA